MSRVDKATEGCGNVHNKELTDSWFNNDSVSTDKKFRVTKSGLTLVFI
jgi:hypothetical protein